jgi:hypothetical protein
MADSIEQLSYEMTASALAEQERALAGLRTRAGTVIAAASVAASLLATHAAAHSAIWTVGLGLMFAISVGAAIAVLLPATLVFAYNGALILTAADAAGDDDVAHAYRAAVAWMQTDLTRNREVISRLAMWFYLSAGALVAEVLLWTISIAR